MRCAVLPAGLAWAHSCGCNSRRKVDHRERSDAQLHEGDRLWGGSVERSSEPRKPNGIEGVGDQGERVCNRKALVIKG
jgi:hypothetical protein